MRVVVSQFEGIDATPALPLAAGCLIAAARTDPELARACELDIAFIRRPIAEAVAEYRGADVIGFSLYPWNTAYSLAVAEAARAAWPDTLIVAGGPAVPRRPERANRFFAHHPAVDILAFGEAEISFPALLRAHLAGTDFAHIPGLAVRRAAPDAGARFTAPAERVREFRGLGSPFLDGSFDALCDAHRERFTMALLESNRGCPFSCTFCDWSLTKHVVEFPIDRVHAELEWIAGRGFGHIMMADANFGIRPRDADIARYIADLRRRRELPRSFYFYLTKNNHARNLETIDILQAADIGCWVGLAVQDFDDGVLDAVKRDNIQTGESRKLRDICGARGIPTFNELILGLPGQSYRSFTATIVEAMPGLPRHDFQIFLCRMIDNTELGSPASRQRHAIETRRCRWKTSGEWDPIIDEYQEVVVGTADMPLADWRRTYRFAYLAAALYNLRLLRVVLRHLGDSGVDMRAYIAHLAAAVDSEPAATVHGALGAVVAMYVDALLAEQPFVLPAARTLELAGADVDAVAETTVLPVDDALATAALWRYPEFLAESERHTRGFLSDAGISLPTLAEAFRYQAHIAPRWGADQPIEADFAHDWPAYLAAGGTRLAARPTRVEYRPPSYTAVPRFAAFAAAHLGCLRVRLNAGDIEVVADADNARPPRRRLTVLPINA